jgi:hypothetical protein
MTIKIRVVYNYDLDSKFCETWNKMTDGDCTFTREDKSIKLYGESLSLDDAHFIIVINGGVDPRPELFYKTIFLKMEPVFVDHRWLNVGKWNVLNIYGTHGMKNTNGGKSFNALEWHLNMTRCTLLDAEHIPKKIGNRVSAVISGKRFDPGHHDRISFTLFAQNFLKFDVYGSYNSVNILWNNFCGSPKTKDSALLPYKYSFACENNYLDFYVTEKLVDCILAETLCFYDGAPNVDKLINENAFIKIDVKNPTKSLRTMKKAIANNEYEKRLPFIKQEKNKIISELSVIPRLWKDLTPLYP